LKIGIVGGGMMGLATAYYLSKAGHEVTILEKEEDVGGLSRSEEIAPGFRWDSIFTRPGPDFLRMDHSTP